MELTRAALSLYGLAGAAVRELPPIGGRRGLPSDQARTFEARFPTDAAEIHPYLGRLAGKSFTLSIGAGSDESSAQALAWVGEMAALCRDTDEDAPEPVPACDGSLVTLIAFAGEARRCVVYR